MKKSGSERRMAVMVCRICPLHLGHEELIRQMIKKYGIKNCLVVIGSYNAPLTMRNFFSYAERRKFLTTVFPGINVVGLGDCPGDNAGWLLALKDMLKLWARDPERVIFFGGCLEDVEIFSEAGLQTEIVNRFDGTTPKISATEVRDALTYGRPVEGLLNPLIAEEVKDLFKRKWELFKKM